jgi:hypothetical protein
VFLLEMDASMPLDESDLERPRLNEHGDPIVQGQHEDGSPIYETELWTPRMRHRVCYPADGIKIELDGDEPVSECDRWDPEDPNDPDTFARERRRAAYAARAQGAAAELARSAEDDDSDGLPDDAATPGVRRRK